MTLSELLLKYPQLKFLKNSAGFNALPREKQEFVIQLFDDAMFWVDLDQKPNSDDGFKFLAASYGLQNAQQEAQDKGIKGKELEQFIRPHQDLYTMFNPYSGNSNEPKKK
ncbi:MAG: hypothetical protein HY539_03375 [Deltaproteobacteria bacterium]|nr:hypothetical protein [Deltaproteobacteria bacterium]MBI4196843.1 hypothetical protein [Deltaproteobacteria bacterium]